MTTLIAGLLIWIVVHFFKRASPSARAGLDRSVGAGPAKGVIALFLLGSIVLIVIGYRAAEYHPVYSTMPGMGHLTALLMLIALFMSGMGQGKGITRAWLRHPLLLAVVVWSVSHLLVNGDVASLVLFGGLGAWAVAEILVLNRALGPWERPESGSLKGDLIGGIIALVLLSIAAGIHIWTGHNPFLGTYG